MSSSILHNESNKKHQMRVTVSQVIPVMIKNVLLIGFGMTIGYPTILIPGLSNAKSDNDFYLGEDGISWIASINMLSLVLGCLLTGTISQTIGRKITMQIGCILMILGWIVFNVSNKVWHVYAALFVIGLTGGLIESPVLTYVAEITQPWIRGTLLSSGSLSITLGMLLEFSLGSVLHWRTLALYSSVPPFMAFVCLFFVPESPIWLIMKNQIKQARKSLAWLRGWVGVAEIEQEFREIENSCIAELNSKNGSFSLKNYTKACFIHPFLLVGYLFLLFHFSGLSAIVTYAIKIFATLEVPVEEYSAAVILGFAQFLGSMACVVIIRFTGKRYSIFISLAIAAISIIIVAIYTYQANIYYLYGTNIASTSYLSNHKWIPLTFLLLTVFALSCGVRNLPWNLVAEVFTNETRAMGVGTLGAINYAIGFGTNKVFLKTVATITLPGVFLAYGLIDSISLIVLYFWLPETEGRTLQEVTDHFSGKNKLGNKVKQKDVH